MYVQGILAMLLLLSAMSGCNQSSDGGSLPRGEANADTAKPKPAGSSDANEKSTATSDAKDKSATGEKPKPGPRASVVIAGGCFWCVEAVFEELDGVYEAVSGYAGGTKETANYDAVSAGTTKHAEAVQIVFDPTKITVEKLLSVHFATHDPTTLNRQGNDVGPQYRSAVFYASDEEKKIAEAMIKRLDESGVFKKKIVTTLEPLTEFFVAESYHQNYVCNNPYNRYVQGVAMPKVDKVREKFKEELKKESPLKE